MSSAIEYLETFSLQCISKDLPTDPDASVELHQYIRQILTSNPTKREGIFAIAGLASLAIYRADGSVVNTWDSSPVHDGSGVRKLYSCAIQ